MSLLRTCVLLLLCLPALPAMAQYNTAATEAEVLRLVNAERARHKLKTLALLPQLADVARLQSTNMHLHGYFAHVDHLGRSSGDRCHQYLPGHIFGLVGENLVEMEPRATPKADAAEAVRLWLSSQTHRENMLHPGYTHSGVGVYAKPDGTLLITQLFAAAQPGKPFFVPDNNSTLADRQWAMLAAHRRQLAEARGGRDAPGPLLRSRWLDSIAQVYAGSLLPDGLPLKTHNPQTEGPRVLYWARHLLGRYQLITVRDTRWKPGQTMQDVYKRLMEKAIDQGGALAGSPNLTCGGVACIRVFNAYYLVLALSQAPAELAQPLPAAIPATRELRLPMTCLLPRNAAERAALKWRAQVQFPKADLAYTPAGESACTGSWLQQPVWSMNRLTVTVPVQLGPGAYTVSLLDGKAPIPDARLTVEAVR